jgi:hypothetical protein
MARKPLETVYTGAYGFRDCDMLGKIWARTPAYFVRAMSRVINSEARTYANGAETLSEIRDQIWYVGPFEEGVEDLVADLEEKGREQELRDDLESSTWGYVY